LHLVPLGAWCAEASVQGRPATQLCCDWSVTNLSGETTSVIDVYLQRRREQPKHGHITLTVNGKPLLANKTFTHTAQMRLIWIVEPPLTRFGVDVTEVIVIVDRWAQKYQQNVRFQWTEPS
jgi:hypothetical protein